MIEFLRNNITDPISRGPNWIYFGYPRTDATFPRISIVQSGGLGYSHQVGGSDQMYEITYDIDVWGDSEHSASISGHTYAGSELVEYLADQVILAYMRNKEYLLTEYGIKDVILTSVYFLPYDEDFDLYRKSMTFNIQVVQA